MAAMARGSAVAGATHGAWDGGEHGHRRHVQRRRHEARPHHGPRTHAQRLRRAHYHPTHKVFVVMQNREKNKISDLFGGGGRGCRWEHCSDFERTAVG